MKRSGMAAVFYLLLTFAAGAAVGGFGHRLYLTHGVRADAPVNRSEEFRRMYLQEMETRLKLSDEQKEKLVTVLDATRNLYRELAEKHRPLYQAIQNSQVEQIDSFLTADQRTEYAKLRKEQEARRKARKGF